MKIKLSHTLVASACCVTFSTSASALTSIQVSSNGKTEIVGSDPTVLSGGTAANFSTSAVILGSTSASFQMVLADGSGTRFADLRLTPVAVKGSLDTVGGTQSGLMIAQTVNSQGLEDGGTFSILTDFSTADGNGVTSMTIRLDWFVPDTNTPLAVTAQITSFDYDFNQFLKVSDSAFISATHGSALTATSTAGFTTWQAGNSDSDFSNPANAVIFDSASSSSMLIEVGKKGTGNSLFMFEFRDPSINLVPEPSSSLLVLSGMLGLVLRRRRDS